MSIKRSLDLSNTDGNQFSRIAHLQNSHARKSGTVQKKTITINGKSVTVSVLAPGIAANGRLSFKRAGGIGILTHTPEVMNLDKPVNTDESEVI